MKVRLYKLVTNLTNYCSANETILYMLNMKAYSFAFVVA